METASANAAKEVARADALARAAQKARKKPSHGLRELERLKVQSFLLSAIRIAGLLKPKSCEYCTQLLQLAIAVLWSGGQFRAQGGAR